MHDDICVGIGTGAVVSVGVDVRFHVDGSVGIGAGIHIGVDFGMRC